ncbi:hypothetical protein FSP39_014940 [Pinctada imbricata]|uniref:Uncharacterized protein n=1 Tax=Pinctada imbricata TaxID=66713 RepID=A0AA89BQZ9_PINIB|nr:hypothetical protein FSP39_014940 [Pinctada imbricata]
MTMLSGIQSTTSSIPKNFPSSMLTKKTKIPRRIFVSYAHSDSVTVNLILDVLRNSGCKIWDPEGDSIPGTYILQNFIDFGIDKTNTAVLFITKNFLSDSFCTFLANHVIGKYIRSEGRYRVIPVLLENCKLPYYLKSVNCISLWRYKRQIDLNNDHAEEYIVRALSRILKAISSPSNSFWKIHRSGSKIITHGGRIIHDVLQFGHKLLSRGRKMGRGVREYMQKERLKRSIPKANKFNPINLLKMAASLKHCLISCRYGSCTFQTYGPEYAKFHEHLQICKFVPVHCKHKGCNVVARRHEMCKHEKKCPFIPMECPNDGCKVKKALCFLDEHMNQCKHALVPCPLKGCKVSVKIKDLNSHRSVCEFRTIEMESDSVPVFSKFTCPNKDCEETFHTKQGLRMHSTICPYAIITCPNTFCDYKNTMARVERHRAVECDYRDVKCRVCFQVLPMKHLDQHKLTCEARIKCENCGLQIRR